MIFFLIKLHIQFQYNICLKLSFFSIRIRFYLQGLIDHSSFQIWDHFRNTA